MSKEQMYQRVLTIQTLKVQAALLKEQIDGLEGELKEQMTADGQSTVETDDFRLKYTDYFAKGLDQTKLKTLYPDVYATCLIESGRKRFTVTCF